MRMLIRALPVFAVLAFTSPAFTCDARKTDDSGNHVKYTVSEQTVTVVSAITPYDSDARAREAFLHWFKRGFETGLTGSSPLMIEWQDSPEGRAGQRGYDFGMDEAQRYLKKKKPNQSLQTTPIPVESKSRSSFQF